MKKPKDVRVFGDISLEILAIEEDLSERTINICLDNDLNSVAKIIDWWRTHKSFLKLRNCGVKTNDELLQVCEKYKNIRLRSVEDVELTDEEKEVFIELTEDWPLSLLAQIENLSQRSYNICYNTGLTSLRLIMQFYLNNKASGFHKFRNCGENTNHELIQLCKKYEYSILSMNTDEEIINNTNSPITKFIESLDLDANNYYIIRDLVSDSEVIPLFKVIDVLINNKQIFKKKYEELVFKSMCNAYYSIKYATYQDIGEANNITRERVRQIHASIVGKLHHLFRFTNRIDINLIPQYYDSDSTSVIVISDEDALKINESEETNFSSIFMTYILSLILKDKYSRFGKLSYVFSNKIYSKNPQIKNLYLINKQLASKFNYLRFFDNFRKLILQNRMTDKFYPFSRLINPYIAGNSVISTDILESVRKILINEFSTAIEIEDKGIVLLANKRKTIPLLIAELLSNSHKPLHYTEIYNHLVENGAKISSEQSVHSVLIREKEIFGLKGAGIWGLRSDGGLFGSIGDVAEQLLNKLGHPIPLKELEILVCNELLVSQDSIKEVLFNYDNEDRFYKERNGNVKLKKWIKK
jgi:hypothetical protein